MDRSLTNINLHKNQAWQTQIRGFERPPSASTNIRISMVMKNLVYNGHCWLASPYRRISNICKHHYKRLKCISVTATSLHSGISVGWIVKGFVRARILRRVSFLTGHFRKIGRSYRRQSRGRNDNDGVTSQLFEEVCKFFTTLRENQTRKYKGFVGSLQCQPLRQKSRRELQKGQERRGDKRDRGEVAQRMTRGLTEYTREGSSLA